MENRYKTRGRVKFYAAACFTSYFVSLCPYLRKWKTRGRMKFYAAASLDSCEMILKNNVEPQKRGRMFSLVLKIQLFQII